MDALVCKGITKVYGGREVLKDVDLTLEEGKIYGLIGRNGAGKTTLLSILSAQNPATAGSVTLDGQRVWENQRALGDICFAREIPVAGEGSTSLGALKVGEYLKTAALYYPRWDGEMARRLIRDFELDPHRKLGRLSKGMLSMVTIVVALASKARFTLLDEPVAGLDVVMREEFYRLLLEEYGESGRSFVVSTHILEEASAVFEEVILLKGGRVLLKENTADLLERACRVSGLEEKVNRAVEGLETHHGESAGRRRSVTVLLRPGERIPQDPELSVQPVTLQNLFVALCGREEQTAPPEGRKG